MLEHEGKIRVAELFYSIQGEGMYVGVPSIFLRMFGCNFTCSGFSMPEGELSEERFTVDPEMYADYKKLPLVHTGCDSYAAWDPRFKHLSPWMTYDEITDRIESLLPGGIFSRSKHLILTGGEPLLWQDKLVPLLDHLWGRLNLTHITFETNGTQILDYKLRDELYHGFNEVVFSISSKLPSSGEPWKKAIVPEAVRSYIPIALPNSRAYFKWVVSHENDLKDIKRAIKAYKIGRVDLPVYLMPAGGTDLHYNENKKWVAELAMKHGWRYSPRVQVDVWRNAWGT